MFNARFVNGAITVVGPQVAVDGANTREAYEGLCGACYITALKLAGLTPPLGTRARQLAGTQN